MTREEMNYKLKELDCTDEIIRRVDSGNIVYITTSNIKSVDKAFSCPEWLKKAMRVAALEHYREIAKELNVECQYKSQL